MPRPRVGRIIGLNALPLWWGMEQQLAGHVDFLDDVPGHLNQSLLAGECQVSLVSALHVARHETLHPVGTVGIAAEGAVGSILLLAAGSDFSRVHLTPHSATSVALARMLLPDRAFCDLQMDPVDVMAQGEAVVVIGDQALALADAQVAGYVRDLGAWWHELTGRPMVYGRLARHERASVHLADAVAAACQAGIAQWQEDPERILDVAVRRYPFALETMRTYLESLRWDLDGHLLGGLEYFLDCWRMQGVRT